MSFADHIKIKLDIMNHIVPKGGDINDFVPLLYTTVPRLHLYRTLAKQDQTVIPGQHRIYYISNLLQVMSPLSLMLTHNVQYLYSLYRLNRLR